MYNHFVRSILFVFSTLLIICLSRTEIVKINKVYQAEQAVFYGVEITKQMDGFSGSGYLTGFNTSHDTVTFQVEAPAKDLYIINIGYRIPDGWGNKYTTMSINGLTLGEVMLKESNTFKETPGERIFLNKGKNTIKFMSGWGYYALDYIRIHTAEPQISNISTKPVNPNATEETKALLRFLVDNYGEYILSGQQDLAGVEWLSDNVGKKPAVVGFDFMDYSPSRVERGNTSNQTEQAIQWAKEGGIVTFSWHWNSPKDLIDEPGKEWNRGFNTDSTNFDLEFAMNNPESVEYKLLLRDIDAISIQLKKLQDAKVPILFRPLHEAEGKWFWWGAKGPKPVKKLYHLLYDRITNYHKINNIIWIWNSLSQEWYPGDKYVDIVSLDSYLDDGDYSPSSIKYNRLVTLVSNKKLIALSENGPIPDPMLIKDYKVYWSWFLTWRGHFLEDGTTNSFEHIEKVYNSPYVLTLDELPDLKTYK